MKYLLIGIICILTACTSAQIQQDVNTATQVENIVLPLADLGLIIGSGPSGPVLVAATNAGVAALQVLQNDYATNKGISLSDASTIFDATVFGLQVNGTNVSPTTSQAAVSLAKAAAAAKAVPSTPPVAGQLMQIMDAPK
jgi:hypothetical protein